MHRLRRLLYRIGIGYVSLDGTEETLWREAARHIPFSYGWTGRSRLIPDLDVELSGNPDWKVLKNSIQAGDRICPFEINPETSAMRRGYVVIRSGEPVGGIITVSS